MVFERFSMIIDWGVFTPQVAKVGIVTRRSHPTNCYGCDILVISPESDYEVSKSIPGSTTVNEHREERDGIQKGCGVCLHPRLQYTA